MRKVAPVSESSVIFVAETIRETSTAPTLSQMNAFTIPESSGDVMRNLGSFGMEFMAYTHLSIAFSTHCMGNLAELVQGMAIIDCPAFA
ncbi:hypothetical protein GCM10020370_43220 [Paenibacillus hodogayensis]